MSISPLSNSLNRIPLTQEIGTGRAISHNTADKIKALTNELEEPVRCFISSEGINVAELANSLPKDFKPPKISQQSIKMVEYDVKLLQATKTLRLEGHGSGDDIEDLARAYEKVYASLNENSENSQSHVKILNEAFKDVARYHFAKDAEQQFRQNVDFNDETQNPNINADAAEKLKQAIADAEKKSFVFSEAFTKNFKAYGIDAFEMAMSLLK